MFSLGDVQQMIDEKYVGEINEIIVNYVNSLAGEELTGIFDFSADFVDCEVVADAKVISHKEEEFDGQIEITGELEVVLEIMGYIHWAGEDIPHDKVEISALAMFSFYYDGNKSEDFQISDIYL